MRVEFDLASLSGPMLETFRLAVTALDKEIPVLAGKIQEWLTDELARRRKKTARGQAMVLPLLREKELECGLAALTFSRSSLRGWSSRLPQRPRPPPNSRPQAPVCLRPLPGLFFFSLHHYPPRGVLFSPRGRRRRGK
jgi:hypothetical protein